MAQATWYSLTPARRQLLIALVIAVVAFFALLGRQLDVATGLRDAGTKEEPMNKADR